MGYGSGSGEITLAVFGAVGGATEEHVMPLGEGGRTTVKANHPPPERDCPKRGGRLGEPNFSIFSTSSRG